MFINGLGEIIGAVRSGRPFRTHSLTYTTNEIVMANTDNSKHVSLESNYGDPALKIINYGSSYNEVNFGLTHSTFIISDDSNKDFLRYDKFDKKTYLQNPHNINFEPLLTEVAADAKFATKDEVQEIKTNFQDNVEVIKSYTLEGDVNSDYYKFYRTDLFDFMITFTLNNETKSHDYYYSDSEVIPGHEYEKDRYMIFKRNENPVEMDDKYFFIDTEYNSPYICDVLDDNFRSKPVFLKSMKILTEEVNQTYSTEIIEFLINANINEIKNETEKIYNNFGMIMSEIEETFATKDEIPNVDLTPYATKTHKINFEVDRKNGGNSFVFNLAKKPSSFSVKIVLRWTNSANEPDWVGITSDVINGTFQNTEVQNATSGTKKRFTFPGQEGSTQIRIDTSIAYWKDGVIRFLPCTSYFTDETLLNYDPDETYFTEYVTYGGDLEPYALKTDIPTIPDLEPYALKTDIPTVDLEPYALKTDIPTIPDNYITDEKLSTSLQNYAKVHNFVDYTFQLDKGDKPDYYKFTIESPPSSFTLHMNLYWEDKSSVIHRNTVDVTVENDTISKFEQETINIHEFKAYDKAGTLRGGVFDEGYSGYSSGVLTLQTLNMTFGTFNVRDHIEFKNDELDYISSDNVVYDSKLKEYATKSECDEKYVKTTGDITINGVINIHPQNRCAINACYENNKEKYICFGETLDKCAELSYYYRTGNAEGCFIISVDDGQLMNVTRRSFQDTDTILYSDLNIAGKLHTSRDLEVAGNLSVSGTITSANSTTITHYAPIETSVNSISDFIVGTPVYFTGNVYKRKNDIWEKSTLEDTTDCICSVKTQGTWKEYVGICTSIDAKNNSITFATHGDFLVRVTDSSCYCVGDEVFIDDDNKLKILAGATAVTAKIRRMTVGIITSIISENILAVFKS